MSTVELHVPSREELDALLAMLRHGTQQQAADAICLSREGMKSRLRRLAARLGLRHMHQIVAEALVRGWITEGEVRQTLAEAKKPPIGGCRTECHNG